MASSPRRLFDVVVVGAGPAGVVAALRAARLGASTALITRDQFGGMAANDGPVPVRTLAQAARLIREARQLPLYGIAGGEPSLDYPRLLARVREVTADARRHTLLRGDLERAGVSIYEQAGPARFAGAHTVESDNAPRLEAGTVILCTGGASRPLPVPGFDLTATHSDAWHLSSVPPSLLVIGAGATGVQVASIFSAFGSRVHLIEIAPRILMSEDVEVSAAVRAALAASGVQVTEDAGTIDRFERCAAGVRLTHSASDGPHSIDATLAVVAAGWAAATAGLDLGRAGVQTGRRGYVQVDAHLRTTVPHVFAAGDITGHALIVHEAARQGLVAATNAVLGPTTVLSAQVSPIGSFTDPEYASAGLTEAAARETREVAVATVRFDSLPRPIIDGRPTGFCKLVVDRELHTIAGLPRRGGARGRARTAGCDSDGREDARRGTRPGPVLVSHLRQRPRPRRDPRRDRPRSHRNVGHRSSRNGSGDRRCLSSPQAHASPAFKIPTTDSARVTKKGGRRMTTPGRDAHGSAQAVARAGSSGPTRPPQTSSPDNKFALRLIGLGVVIHMLRSRRFYQWVAIGAVVVAAVRNMGQEQRASTFERLSAWNRRQIEILERKTEQQALRLERKAKREARRLERKAKRQARRLTGRAS